MAEKAGMSTKAFAQKEKNKPGREGKAARFVLLKMGFKHPKGKARK